MQARVWMLRSVRPAIVLKHEITQTSETSHQPRVILPAVEAVTILKWRRIRKTANGRGHYTNFEEYGVRGGDINCRSRMNKNEDWGMS